jgi:hypothetical protein
MIMTADASIRQLASYFSLGDLTAGTSRGNMSATAGAKYDNLLRSITTVSKSASPRKRKALHFEEAPPPGCDYVVYGNSSY